MLDNGTAAYLQKYQDRISAITDPTANPQMTTPYTNPAANNVTSGYSLNNDYAVGNRIYNGFSPSPQAGPGSVDPAGYNLRDSAAAVKNNLLTQKLGG
jgi:hypothetical protein